jgi:tetratricopeptide (TPR) repeat protein
MAKAYKQLAETLEARQKDFEKVVTEEDALWGAFLSFSIPDPRLAAPLDEWVETSNGSWPARLARGIYFEKLAFSADDSSPVHDLTPQAIEAMRRYVDKAELDFRAAVARNSKAIMAYDGLIGINQLRGERAAVDQAYQSALRLAPASFLIRAARMHSLRPRWGGSYEEMKVVAEQARPYLQRNPRLASLSGYVALDQAELAKTRDLEPAVHLLSQAISAAEDPAFFSARGFLQFRLHQYSEALSDFDRALALRPGGWWYAEVRLASTLIYKGRCLFHLERYDEALEALGQAKQVDPFAEESSADWWITYIRKVTADRKPK